MFHGTDTTSEVRNHPAPPFISGPSSHLGISKFVMHTCLAEKTIKLSYRSCQTAIETLTPGWSQTSPMANLVMYCCIIVDVRRAFRATFVCSILYTHVESTSYTNATYTIRAIKAHLLHILHIFVHILALNTFSEYFAVK